MNSMEMAKSEVSQNSIYQEQIIVRSWVIAHFKQCKYFLFNLVFQIMYMYMPKEKAGLWLKG